MKYNLLFLIKIVIRNNLDKYYRKEVTKKVLEEFTETYNYNRFQ